MSDIEQIIDAVKTLGEVEVVKAEQAVENAATIIKNDAVSENQPIEAELVKAKSAADLILEEIDNASTVLYQAKMKSVKLADQLKREASIKIQEINEELKKMGAVPLLQVKTAENWVENKEESAKEEIKSHPVISTAITFIVGLVGGAILHWLI